ncbi:flavodoxin [Companilactobacillus halodurans]|uniref:Flavodoxin n=1 Tax=Companilactobacillus halodurans TaxID=2584183 RepID=A0A5P0ZRW3_9LACO|nr:flavodoxin [Companilactobacillus halodurans]MQS76968.1 flavodoxin [Companilactobacillus halodurans]MQS96390.1 flavodoxin [Companilactobacillus halodurans]
MAKLIIYFSLSNNTKKAAQKIQEITQADIVRLEKKTPYPVDYSDYSKIGQQEFEDETRPEIKIQLDNLDQYDTIFLGYPTWSGRVPMIFYTLFDKYDFSNKKIIPFTTSGGSSIAESMPYVKKLANNSTVTKGFRYTGDDKQLKEFLNQVI